jgi:hypothetical protein
MEINFFKRTVSSDEKKTINLQNTNKETKPLQKSKICCKEGKLTKKLCFAWGGILSKYSIFIPNRNIE